MVENNKEINQNLILKNIGRFINKNKFNWYDP